MYWAFFQFHLKAKQCGTSVSLWSLHFKSTQLCKDSKNCAIIRTLLDPAVLSNSLQTLLIHCDTLHEPCLILNSMSVFTNIWIKDERKPHTHTHVRVDTWMWVCGPTGTGDLLICLSCLSSSWRMCYYGNGAQPPVTTSHPPHTLGEQVKYLHIKDGHADLPTAVWAHQSIPPPTLISGDRWAEREASANAKCEATRGENQRGPLHFHFLVWSSAGW